MRLVRAGAAVVVGALWFTAAYHLTGLASRPPGEAAVVLLAPALDVLRLVAAG